MQIRCGWRVYFKTEQHPCNVLGRLWQCLHNSPSQARFNKDDQEEGGEVEIALFMK